MRLPSRRAVLGGVVAASAAAAGLYPRRSLAAPSRSQLKFIFVRNFGGWDPTRVYATELDNASVAYEEDAELAEIGGLRFVDHPERPSVRSFFENHASRSLILNGMIVPSVNHRICERLAYTGSNLEIAPDMPTLIADAQGDLYGLPHVQIGGRAMPGNLARSLVRIGDEGQVGRLLDGSILETSDLAVNGPSPAVAALLDAHALESAVLQSWRTVGKRGAHLDAAVASALRKAETMKALGDAVRWNTDGTFQSQVDLAMDLLSLGLSRCCTLAYDSQTWDSHEANDEKQTANFETLFAYLGDLLDALEATPGPLGGTLADETVVMVTSEMGRTPYVVGDSKGKDHWAHTSALLVGPGITAGRVIGGFTDLFYGDTVDLASGELSTSGRELTPAIFNSTVLALADVDGADTLREWAPVMGALT